MHDEVGCQPNVVYVTGGTAKSPVVRSFIESACPRVPIVVGDFFGSVASELRPGRISSKVAMSPNKSLEGAFDP